MTHQELRMECRSCYCYVPVGDYCTLMISSMHLELERERAAALIVIRIRRWRRENHLLRRRGELYGDDGQD